jgi:hypothetical protein
MILSFVFRRFWTSLFLIISFKFVATTITYFLVTKKLQEKLDKMLREFDIYYLLKYMAMRRPMKTLILIRFSLVPKFFKNYGIPLLGYSYWPFINISTLSDIYFTIIPILVGMTARTFTDISEDDSSDHKGNNDIRIITIIISFISISFFVYFIYLANRIMNGIQAQNTMDQIREKVDERSESFGSVKEFLGTR